MSSQAMLSTPLPSVFELHDAEKRTASWRMRHSPEEIKRSGAWRWLGIRRHSHHIMDLVLGKRVIDFGGADGPLGIGSIIVDPKAEHKTLDDVPGQVDVIFTSHTLEHLCDLRGALNAMVSKLVPGGVMIVHVPAWTCKRWRSGNYDNPNQDSVHRRTFCLLKDDVDNTCEGSVVIDLLLREWFHLFVAEHCGDDSLLLIGSKCE